MDKFLETIHDMIEIITGKRPEEQTKRCELKRVDMKHDKSTPMLMKLRRW